MHEVREHMLQERDRAVEREREAASVRLREQSERLDQQLQAQRVRMVEDMAQVLVLARRLSLLLARLIESAMDSICGVDGDKGMQSRQRRPV